MSGSTATSDVQRGDVGSAAPAQAQCDVLPKGPILEPDHDVPVPVRRGFAPARFFGLVAANKKPALHVHHHQLVLLIATGRRRHNKLSNASSIMILADLLRDHDENKGEDADPIFVPRQLNFLECKRLGKRQPTPLGYTPHPSKLSKLTVRIEGGSDCDIFARPSRSRWIHELIEGCTTCSFAISHEDTGQLGVAFPATLAHGAAPLTLGNRQDGGMRKANGSGETKKPRPSLLLPLDCHGLTLGHRRYAMDIRIPKPALLMVVSEGEVHEGAIDLGKRRRSFLLHLACRGLILKPQTQGNGYQRPIIAVWNRIPHDSLLRLPLRLGVIAKPMDSARPKANIAASIHFQSPFDILAVIWSLVDRSPPGCASRDVLTKSLINKSSHEIDAITGSIFVARDGISPARLMTRSLPVSYNAVRILAIRQSASSHLGIAENRVDLPSRLSLSLGPLSLVKIAASAEVVILDFFESWASVSYPVFGVEAPHVRFSNFSRESYSLNRSILPCRRPTLAFCATIVTREMVSGLWTSSMVQGDSIDTKAAYYYA
ncbi:hypothetical protein C8J56DRAFT_1034143 [Mycena floridula]|nr:hypothetical protein C8J56DRAFT_1034143 [Mycena floridula]